jgi:hypothetical protein
MAKRCGTLEVQVKDRRGTVHSHGATLCRLIVNVS